MAKDALRYEVLFLQLLMKVKYYRFAPTQSKSSICRLTHLERYLSKLKSPVSSSTCMPETILSQLISMHDQVSVIRLELNNQG
jgi:hypothetical protein